MSLLCQCTPAWATEQDFVLKNKQTKRKEAEEREMSLWDEDRLELGEPARPLSPHHPSPSHKYLVLVCVQGRVNMGGGGEHMQRGP